MRAVHKQICVESKYFQTHICDSFIQGCYIGPAILRFCYFASAMSRVCSQINLISRVISKREALVTFADVQPYIKFIKMTTYENLFEYSLTFLQLKQDMIKVMEFYGHSFTCLSLLSLLIVIHDYIP